MRFPVRGDGFHEWVDEQVRDARPGARFLGVFREATALLLVAELPGGVTLTRRLSGPTVRSYEGRERQHEFDRRLADEVVRLRDAVANTGSVLKPG